MSSIQSMDRVCPAKGFNVTLEMIFNKLNPSNDFLTCASWQLQVQPSNLLTLPKETYIHDTSLDPVNLSSLLDIKLCVMQPIFTQSN